VPPAGADFNGILNLVTAIQQWQSAGGNFKWDSAFSTSVGGYPKGAVLINSTNDGMWFNLADNNTTNPDATDGSAANWAPIDAYGATSIALTNANVTMTPAQFSKPIIVLTGTLTGNVQLTMPKLVGMWYVVNSTTGAFTTQLLTASGTPLTIAQGGAAWVRGDGTNVLNDALQIPPATQSQHALQLGQATGRLLRITTITSTQTYNAGAGTTAVKVKLQGGGCSGAGTPANSSSQIAVGSGGTPGAYQEGFFTSGFSGVTVTIGAGGAAVANGTNAGGTSSFGGLMSCAGGSGAAAFQGTAPASVGGNGGAAATGSGYLKITGGAGGVSVAFSNAGGYGGVGGNSLLGSGGSASSAAVNGQAATGFGAGGGGVYQTVSGVQLAGGAGSQGICIIEEYGTI
jgi:hypothetical protein